MKIGFIGVGHMASSILEALTNNKTYSFNICDLDDKKTTHYANLMSDRVKVCDILSLVDDSDVIFLGVKPKDLHDVLSLIKDNIKDQLVISMAAGFNISEIIDVTGDIHLIRIMPNTPVLVSSGVTFYTGYNVTSNDLTLFKEMMAYTGSIYEIEESKMDVVSVLTGSSPAYLDFFLDALSEFGVSLGFSKSEATEFVLKMAQGVTLLNLNSNKSLKELGRDVCSPGGSTIEGVKVLLDNGLYDLVNAAATASYNKNKNMK